MFPLFAIPLIGEAVTQTPAAVSYFDRPIDVMLFDAFVWFGWIPIVTTVIWGIVIMWQNYRVGLYVSGYKWVVLAIDVPAMTEQTPKALENLFATIYGAKSSLTWKEQWVVGKVQPTFSFEIISTEGYIQFLVRTQTRFRDNIEAGIYAHYPDAEITEVEDYVKYFPSNFPDEEYDMWGGEFVLDKPEIYPIRTYVDFEDRLTGEIKDPLGHTLEQLAKMRPGEHFWIQFIVQPQSNDWMQAGVNKLNALYGKKAKVKKSPIMSALESVLAWPVGMLENVTGADLSFLFGGAAEEKKEPMVFLPLQETKEAEAIYHKIGKVGLLTKIRIVYIGRKNVFVKVERTTMVKGILNQYTNLTLNKFALFIPQVPKDDYFWMRWVYTKKQRNLMNGYKTRNWGIGADPFYLNVEELASLWHFPTIGFKPPLVKKAEARRAEPPVGLPITHEEITFPGLTAEPELPIMPSEGSPEAPVAPEGETSPVPADTLSTAEVPRVEPPTKPKEDTDSYVPPNLPM
ncbi:hypothetical protein FJZ23_00015 [Candidatus Parcubacteria bacterium]|nr:hypothetical protein [Candidatus Parcubacteria bacterium]